MRIPSGYKVQIVTKDGVLLGTIELGGYDLGRRGDQSLVLAIKETIEKDIEIQGMSKELEEV